MQIFIGSRREETLVLGRLAQILFGFIDYGEPRRLDLRK